MGGSHILFTFVDDFIEDFFTILINFRCVLIYNHTKERASMGKKITTEEFIEKANRVHNFLYYYLLTDYNYMNEKVRIICSIHGDFYQTPDAHIGKYKCGCPKCGILKILPLRTLKLEDFLLKASLIHNNKYDYSLIKEISGTSNVDIICPIHKQFKQKARRHMNGDECYQCSYDKRARAKSKSLNDFIIEANRLHNNFYDYSLVVYVNAKTKIIIICPKHGQFEQTPDKHLHGKHGRGCSQCTSRISKKEIRWLDSLNIAKDSKHRNVFSN